jgi:hypothetical protein
MHSRTSLPLRKHPKSIIRSSPIETSSKNHQKNNSYSSNYLYPIRKNTILGPNNLPKLTHTSHFSCPRLINSKKKVFVDFQE